MKSLKLLVLLIIICLISSCSKKEEDFNFIGVWDLQRYQFATLSVGSSQHEFYDAIDVDENCLFESTLTIQANNVAILNLTSTITNTLQVVDETTNEIEQVITCENVEQEIELNWLTGDFSVSNEEGSGTKSYYGGDQLIRFIDENGDVIMRGLFEFGRLSFTFSDDFNNRTYLDVDEQEIEFVNYEMGIFTRSF